MFIEIKNITHYKEHDFFVVCLIYNNLYGTTLRCRAMLINVVQREIFRFCNDKLIIQYWILLQLIKPLLFKLLYEKYHNIRIWIEVYLNQNLPRIIFSCLTCWTLILLINPPLHVEILAKYMWSKPNEGVKRKKSYLIYYKDSKNHLHMIKIM